MLNLYLDCGKSVGDNNEVCFECISLFADRLVAVLSLTPI
jgi:hypothetical protein